jgi:hypothetical protein
MEMTITDERGLLSLTVGDDLQNSIKNPYSDEKVSES